MSIVLGANSFQFDGVKASVPGLLVRRVYRDIYGYIPTGWPFPAEQSVLSFRPDLSRLFTGADDVAIRHFLNQAPPGSYLSSFHEAGSLNKGQTYSGLSQQSIRSAHVYLHNLCRDYPNVSYGTITCGPPESKFPWVPKPGYPMDFYGVDIYDGMLGDKPSWRDSPTAPLNKAALYARMDANWTFAKHRNPSPTIIYPETNSMWPVHRAEWFGALAAWQESHGGGVMCTYWNPHGSLSGPFLPNDTATIAELNRIAGPASGDAGSATDGEKL